MSVGSVLLQTRQTSFQHAVPSYSSPLVDMLEANLLRMHKPSELALLQSSYGHGTLAALLQLELHGHSTIRICAPASENHC